MAGRGDLPSVLRIVTLRGAGGFVVFALSLGKQHLDSTKAVKNLLHRCLHRERNVRALSSFIYLLFCISCDVLRGETARSSLFFQSRGGKELRLAGSTGHARKPLPGRRAHRREENILLRHSCGETYTARRRSVLGRKGVRPDRYFVIDFLSLKEEHIYTETEAHKS